ncbi:MAG: SPOR domain-containing protein [Amaricoccus sp.]
MHDTYSDDYSSVAIDDRLIPEGARRLAGAAVFVALVAGMGLWSYRLGTRDAGEVPVIKAIDGPARIQPEDPGGLQAAHQGLEVNRVLGGAPARPASETVAAAKAFPSPITTEDEPQGELVTKAPAALAERLAKEAPVANEAAVAPDLAVAAVPADADPEPAAAVLGDADVTADEEAAAAAEPRPRNRPSNLSFARATAPATAERPAAAERPATAKPAALATASVATAALPTPTPAVAAAPAAPKDGGGRPAAGARLVQLGAFDNEAMARTAWNQLLAKNGDLLGSKSLYVERTTANARVFYRLRVAGFSNADQTRAMCEQLRSRGIACIPVTLQ